MPGLRNKLAALALRTYPFYSGCGTLANSPLARGLAPDLHQEVWARVPGGNLVLAPLDDYVGRAAYYVGDLDRKITWVCSQLVAPGDIVLDIGANIGVVTLILSSLVGENGRVHSFEPNPRLNRNIEQAIARNRLTNVELHKVGLGEHEETLELTVPPGNSGAGSFLSHLASASGSVIAVPVRPLSAVLADARIDRLNVIKIDVEGFEPQVLRGGFAVLQKLRPRAIIFELNDNTVAPWEHPTIKILQQLDYRFFTLPKRLLGMHAKAWAPASGTPLDCHDLVASPIGTEGEKVARLLGT